MSNLLVSGAQEARRCCGMVYRMAQPPRTSCRVRINRFCVRYDPWLMQLTLAQMTLAAVSMSQDFNYVPTNDQTVAVFIGFILFHGLVNTLNTAWLARITKVSCLMTHLTSSITHSSILLALSLPSSPSRSCNPTRTTVIPFS